MSDLIPYLGAKRSRGTLLQILGHMAQHDCFIETHLGTGAVINAKPPSVRDIGIDKDAITLSTFEYVETAEIINGDCHSFLRNFNCKAHGRVLIYADPPYVGDTRTSTKKYRHDYTEDDHRDLLAILSTIEAAVMISGYPSALYDDLLGDWRTHEFQAMTRGGVRTEKLWMNYDPPPPFWHTQAGVDAEDRRRIKRLAGRWGANFAGRTPMEQIAILAAIAAADQALEAIEVETIAALSHDLFGAIK